ncbi:Gfo/Idh/MocA family oxidoreductase [Brevibacillus humidisoli]|uniref:Gfo/Idh/MocA family protein n=1 Tax=Brevibacillus humidisoli TaxID=2895522 RepID=UPI001E5C1E71|nr:Gfo/Idh/MocA family oxidoreductase [Brevibacillus humidisoli]UFJ42395.1 Gfo/Idh/MocA family oxidoreductase [Brevibacillus humidisoli]
MTKLRVGVIGCGKIAQVRHIPEYKEKAEVAITAVSDVDIHRARAVAAEHGIPRAYADYRQVIEADDIEAVSVCTPNVYHAEISMEALRAGKHVLVEKPMAVTLEQCEEMVRLAQEQNKVLMVGMNQRFLPLYRRVKAIVESGRLGRIRQFSTNFHHGGPEDWSIDGAKSWFTRRSEAGHGVIADLGVHKIDLIQWLLNQRVEEIVAYPATFAQHRDVEDAAVLAVRMTEGTLGTAHLSWNNPLQDHRTVLYGERGVLTVGETICGITVETFDGERYEEEVPLPLRADGMIQSGVIAHFMDSILTGQQPESSGEQVLHAMRVCFAAVNGAGL